MNYKEYIADYLNHSLSDEDKKEFESALSSNKELQQLVADWENTDAIVGKHILAQQNQQTLTSTLQHFTTEYFNTHQKPTKIFSIKRIISISAIAAALILAFFLIQPSDISNFKLPDYPGAIVRGIEDDSKKGAQLFNEKKYTEALPLLKSVYNSNPDDATVAYFYGLCAIKTKDYATALPILENISNGTSAYKDDANFFVAYSAYQLDQKDKAVKYAQQVKTDNNYFENAQKLLKKLQ